MVKGVSKFIFWVRPFIDLDYLIGIQTLFFNYKFFQKRLLLFLKNVGRKIREKLFFLRLFSIRRNELVLMTN